MRSCSTAAQYLRRGEHCARASGAAARLVRLQPRGAVAHGDPPEGAAAQLEIETEAQILHKHEEEGPHRSEFDPLELDRYSSIQQYSRALAETANDVASIQQLLENLAKDTQNLLQQQARTITELQNGLMRTRMVPFQRHVQRLARIVRQAASDTGKRAELIVEGASGELDRQVLERMLPPFEHMLRNAVVHGIEKPEERVARRQVRHRPHRARAAPRGRRGHGAADR